MVHGGGGQRLIAADRPHSVSSYLPQCLTAAKRAGGNNAAGITNFAQAAGVSHATAQRIVSAVFGQGGTGAVGRRKQSGAGR